MGTSEHGIVVGVAHADEDTAPLRWAAEESRLRDLPVTLIHAVGAVVPPPPPNLLLTYEPVMEVARSLTREAAERFTHLNGGVAPRATRLEPGRAGHVLTELSAEADLVVLGRRELNPLRRLVTGSTAVTVAGHAHAPVVVVPESWGEERPASERGWVTVGVHEDHAPPQVLQAAFEAARIHGWGVRLVHAWRADPVYDDIILDRIDPQWKERVEDEIRSSADSFLTRFDDVKVDVLALHDWPADALVDLSRESDLVVVGRRGHPGRLPHGMGSIARTVVRAAHGPVMVVPVPPASSPS